MLNMTAMLIISCGLIQHKYIRVGGGYRHSYWYVKAMMEEIELQVSYLKSIVSCFILCGIKLAQS